MKNSLNNSILNIFILVLLAPGCRKDPPVVVEPIACQETDCPGLPEPEGVFWSGYSFDASGVQYRSPFFNPNNDDEFVHLRREGSSLASTELVKHTISSGEEQVLCTGLPIIGQPNWGRNGWIVFYTISHKVWKVYKDGSGLEQLTFGVKDLWPMHNFDGSQVYYYREKNYSGAELDNNPELYKEYLMMVIDINGNKLDSVTICDIKNPPGECIIYQEWSKADVDENDVVYMKAGTGDYLGLYKLNLSLDTIVQPIVTWTLTSGKETVADLCYHNDLIYFSKYRNGLYKASTKLGYYKPIIEPCETRFYEYLSISQDGTKLLAEKVRYDSIVKYESAKERHQIVLIDLEGCGQEVILGGE